MNIQENPSIASTFFPLADRHPKLGLATSTTLIALSIFIFCQLDLLARTSNSTCAQLLSISAGGVIGTSGTITGLIGLIYCGTASHSTPLTTPLKRRPVMKLSLSNLKHVSLPSSNRAKVPALFFAGGLSILVLSKILKILAYISLLAAAGLGTKHYWKNRTVTPKKEEQLSHNRSYRAGRAGIPEKAEERLLQNMTPSKQYQYKLQKAKALLVENSTPQPSAPQPSAPKPSTNPNTFRDRNGVAIGTVGAAALKAALLEEGTRRR